MKKVYIVQEPLGRNVLPASAYGKLEVLLPDGQIVLSPGPTINKLRSKLKNFDDGDFLLLLGDPVALAMSAMVAAEANAGMVTFLKWDRQEKAYYPVQVSLRRNGDGN